MLFPYDEVYHKMEIRWEKVLILWEKYDYQFLRFSPYYGFCCIFPYYMGSGIDGKTHAFPIYFMYTIIGWESDGQKLPIYNGKKYDHQFPRFSPYNGFCCIFPYHGKLMGKPIYFPDEVYHRMGFGWEKTTHTNGKSMITNFPGFSHTIGFVVFSCTMGNWWENTCISAMMKYTIG